MILGKDAIVQLYRKRAGSYDLAADLYYLLGYRLRAYRRDAVAALQLKPGDTVIDLCCGTGLNFPLLQRYVGPDGHIIGVDITDAMLAQAHDRVQRNQWDNVTLIQQDVALYDFPENVDGIISVLALTLVDEYDEVIRKAAGALARDGHFVLLDLKESSRMPLWLLKLAVWFTRPFGVRLELRHRHPWESMETYLDHVQMQERYLGFSYIATGKAHHGR
jgi:demethylmenaquinone methyltransferase/2-methoxy-6-polyprenyl-1,4-benzoquinol methylase